MTWQGGFNNPVSQLLPGQVNTSNIADGAITSIKLASDLQSDNFVTGVSGWRIRRNTGDAEFNNVTVRGTIEASVFRTASTGKRLVIDGTNNETFVQIFNQSNQVVGQMGFAPTGWGSDQMVFYGGASTGGVVIASDGSIELNAVGSSGIGVVITNPAPVGALPGIPFRIPNRMRIHNSTAPTTPTWAFDNDPDTGIYRSANNTVDIATGGVRRAGFSQGSGVFFGAGGTSSADEVFRWDGNAKTIALHNAFPDIGNHEVLRADRGTGNAVAVIGYFSSYAKNKRGITPLSKSSKWKREWFLKLEPVTFIRRSTKGREFGFVIDQFKEIDDNLKYLTTKGNEWGESLDEFGLLAVTVDYVQYLESRVRLLEERVGAT